MKVKLYVRWTQEEILTEAELEKLIATKQLERRQDRDCMAEDINEYLDRYNRYEIFLLTGEEKEEIIERVMQDSDEWVRNDVLDEFDEIYIEI